MEIREIILVGIVCCAISVFLHLLYISWFMDKCGEYSYMISPATLHKMTKMNWVGCIIYWILGLALAPIFTITGIFAWLFTIGRRD